MEKNQNADKAELYSGNRAAVGDRLKEYMKENRFESIHVTLSAASILISVASLIISLSR